MSCQNCKKTPIYSLPNDVIFTEILPRLPAKSLMRFKCVSKSFETVISSPDFTKLYLRHKPSEFLILPGNGRIKCYDIDSATETFALNNGGPVSVLWSVNGVLCILPNATNQLLLLNPTTRIYRAIPPDFKMEFSGVRRGDGFSIGFAFDHENQDFKIVGVSNGNPQHVIKTRVTKVYSLNNNSWTELESLENQHSIIKYPGGTLSNTHLLHWMSWSHSLRKRNICCFDACKNTWVDDLLLPHYYYDSSENVILLEIGVLDDRMFSSFERVGHGNDVWVMTKDGVQDSWVKLLSIPNSKGIHTGVVPLTCRGLVGDILMRQRRTTWLFWYHRTDHGMTNAKFDGAPDFSEFQLLMCRSSLVDIPGGKRINRSR